MRSHILFETIPDFLHRLLWAVIVVKFNLRFFHLEWTGDVLDITRD